MLLPHAMYPAGDSARFGKRSVQTIAALIACPYALIALREPNLRSLLMSSFIDLSVNPHEIHID